MFEGVDGQQWKEHSHSEAALEHMHHNPKVNVSIKSYISAHTVPVYHKGSQCSRVTLRGKHVIQQLAFWKSLPHHITVYHQRINVRYNLLNLHLYCRDARTPHTCNCEYLSAAS